MSKKENGIRELDDSGAVVMSGSMQAMELMGEKRDAEKNTKLSTDSSILEAVLKVRAASGDPGKPEMNRDGEKSFRNAGGSG